MLAALAAGGALLWRDARSAEERLSAATAEAQALAGRLDGLERAMTATPDPADVIQEVEGSVFSVLADGGAGSAFVVSSTDARSTLVTNYHVVQATWEAGGREVDVVHAARRYTGIIVRVHTGDDLATVTVPAKLQPLLRAKKLPRVGDPVLAVGSPFGFEGTATSGILSGIRDEYLQFSAPVSPGSSGGPLLDERGRVIGVTVAKIVATGAEGLSFAVPIGDACRGLGVC